MVIAAGAVLAAVIVTRTPAQQATGVGVCCYAGGYCELVQGDLQACLDSGSIYIPTGESCDDCPPPPGPTVVGVSMTQAFSGDLGVDKWRVVRAWSDGQTDITWIEFVTTQTCAIQSTCGPQTIISGTCPTDVDRDGDTGINDFLTLLGGWGACR